MAGKKRNWICAGILVLFVAGISLYASGSFRDWKQKGDTAAKPQKEAVEQATEEEENTEVTHIVMTYQTLGQQSKLDDLDEVVEAINEISRKEIGVEVELKVSEATESFTDYPLWISQGEPIDLMILNYQDLCPFSMKTWYVHLSLC